MAKTNMPQVPDWTLYIQSQLTRHFHKVANKTGLLELDSSSNNFRPTLYGAYVMTRGGAASAGKANSRMLKLLELNLNLQM